MLGLQIAVGIAGLAGSFAGAMALLSDPSEPVRGEVHVGRAADWPEIKNGVPELVSARPAAPAPAVPAPPPGASEPTGAAIPERAQIAAQGGSEAAPLLPAVEAPPPLAPELRSSTSELPPEPAAATPRPADAPTGLQTASAQEGGLDGIAARQAAPAPLPPRQKPQADARQRQDRSKSADKAKTAARQRPAPTLRAAASKVEPRTKHAARAANARGAQTAADAGESPPQNPGSAAAPVKDETVRLLGIPVPGGRQIKEALDSIGDAVSSLPSRL